MVQCLVRAADNGSGVFTLKDYDYENPGTNLLATANHQYKFEHGDMEIYNYPGGYDKQSEGVTLASVTRDSELNRNARWWAAGYAPSLTPGYTVQRTSLDADDASDNDTYLALRCSHAYGSQSYVSQGAGSAAPGYVGGYELAKSSIPYRMPQRTHKPVIVGGQSAFVVGKEGEEIDVDEQGRVRVQFYWDRKKKHVAPSAGRAILGGQHRGTLYIPRIGDEVMVAYEEGDPDRPIVVGSVYNGTNTVPTPLPAKKTHSGILTRSSTAATATTCYCSTTPPAARTSSCARRRT